MKKLLLALLAVTVTGCAGNQVFKAAPQNYRLKDSDKTVEIKGAVFKKSGVLTSDVWVGIYFDNPLQIEIPLDSQFNGENTGKDFEGKKTSATCNGREKSSIIEVRCTVFIDNEKTVTLTF
jgi:hypothetical protein